MKRAVRQARRITGFFLHHIGRFILASLLVLLLLFGSLAYRLSQGPLNIPYAASVLATAVSGQGIRVHVAKASLAWGGYHQGGGAPLYLSLGGITVSNASHVELAEIPSGKLIFSLAGLFGGGAPILVNSTDMRFNGSDVAVSLRAAIRLGLGFRLSRADLTGQLGRGHLGAGGLSAPIAGGGFKLAVTPHDVALLQGRVLLAPAGASAPVITLTGALHLNTLWQGGLSVTGDQVQAGDLAAYWPAALAAQTRSWVLANIFAGTARDMKFQFGLSAPKDFSSLDVTSAAGGLAAQALSLRWLPHAVPMTGLHGRLTLQNLDTLLITADGGALGGITLTGGAMNITGLTRSLQLGAVTVHFGGALADAIAVLNAPPLSLLRTAPPQVARATGAVTGMVTAKLPLKSRIGLPEVSLNIEAALADVAVALPLAGVGFTGGALRLQASNHDLALAGTAMLAGEPASLSARVDFRTPQPLRGFDLATRLGPDLLSRMGLAAARGGADAVTGNVPLTLHIETDENDRQTVFLQADLTPAGLGVPALGWAKPPGGAGALQIHATLEQAGGVRVDAVAAQAEGLNIVGTWQQDRLALPVISIGQTRAQGEVTPPANGSPWLIALHGTVLDVRAILNPPVNKQAAAQLAPPPGPPTGPAWRATLDFASLHLAPAPAPSLHDFTFSGSGKGGAVLAATAQAANLTGQPVEIAIKPVSADGSRRNVQLTAGDAGDLLRVLGAYEDLQGGALTLAGAYGAGGLFEGNVRLAKFRLLQAPAIGKILQAATIYGAAEAASGPGLAFSQLVAPFDISQQILTFKGARAYSASLGFTVSGTVDLALGNVDLNTTIVPAYALNALPGKIPVIGKLFSAEKGGGLFALRAQITGTLGKPDVSVNPFSALTPGFLRGLFGPAAAGPGPK